MSEIFERFLLGAGALAIVGLSILILGDLRGSLPLQSSLPARSELSAAVRPVIAAVSPPSPSTHLTPVPSQADSGASRYFPQTGFRIDNDTIWDYFVHRGGVATFGYPTSRSFLLDGLQVQFFQRRIIQVDAHGHARLLNVLDPNLLPYSTFGSATFPAFDRALVASAPPVTNVTATLAWVRAHAPDTYQDQPVRFYQTFLESIPSDAVSDRPGTNPFMAGFALEMWGIPTSTPQMDPHNHDVIYLRFQRGIMQYDTACRCTQSVLLADYLKSILTGVNLDPALDREARSNPLYLEYVPGDPLGLRHPAAHPGTDLTQAFEPQGPGE